MIEYIIIDDEQEPINLLLKYGASVLQNAHGLHASKTSVAWDESIEGRVEQVNTIEAMCARIDGLLSNVVLLSDLNWEELGQRSLQWKNPENPVRQAVLRFIARHPLNRFVVYSSHAHAKEIVIDFETQTGRNGQIAYLEKNFADRNRNEMGVNDLVGELEVYLNALTDPFLDSIWRSSESTMFTSPKHCVPHQFSRVKDKSCYIHALAKAIDLPSPLNDAYFNEGFHEAIKNLVGGDSLVASFDRGDPLNVGGVLGLAVLAFYGERETLPNWPVNLLTKQLAGTRFVYPNRITNLYCPIRSRQIACALFKCFKHLLAKENEDYEPRLRLGHSDFTIEVGWDTDKLIDKLKSIGTCLSHGRIESTTTEAVAVVSELLALQPGSIEIKFKREIWITAE